MVIEGKVKKCVWNILSLKCLGEARQGFGQVGHPKGAKEELALQNGEGQVGQVGQVGRGGHVAQTLDS